MLTRPIVLLCVLVPVLLAPAEDAEKECMKEYSLTDQDMLNFDLKTTTEKFLCFSKCFYTKVGVIDENGKINLESFDYDGDSDESIDDEAMDIFTRCVEGIDRISKCGHMSKLHHCLEKVSREFRKK